MNYYIQKYQEYTESLKMKEGEKVKGKDYKIKKTIWKETAPLCLEDILKVNKSILSTKKEYQKGIKVSEEIYELLNRIKNETGIPLKKLVEMAVNEKYGNKGDKIIVNKK